MLLAHLIRIRLLFARLLRAGKRMEIKSAIIPMTTSNSTSVKPLVRRDIQPPRPQATGERTMVLQD